MVNTNLDTLHISLHFSALVTESLEYPEFSVIAMYKRLVVGVALMTPTGYISYFLVHPDFRQSNIGSIMLFFLIQVFFMLLLLLYLQNFPDYLRNVPWVQI